MSTDDSDGVLRPTPGPTYRPHLVSRSGHTASFFGYVKLPVRLSGGQNERVRLADGGAVLLHWWSARHLPTRSIKPVVLLVHGSEPRDSSNRLHWCLCASLLVISCCARLHAVNNSSSTPYIQYLMSHLEESGFEAVCVNMRGHGHGNPICSARLYQARADDDLRRVCEVSKPFHLGRSWLKMIAAEPTCAGLTPVPDPHAAAHTPHEDPTCALRRRFLNGRQSTSLLPGRL